MMQEFVEDVPLGTAAMIFAPEGSAVTYCDSEAFPQWVLTRTVGQSGRILLPWGKWSEAIIKSYLKGRYPLAHELHIFRSSLDYLAIAVVIHPKT